MSDKSSKQVHGWLLEAGQSMSNVLYNMKQDQAVPANWRALAEQRQTEWDNLRNRYNEALKVEREARLRKLKS